MLVGGGIFGVWPLHLLQTCRDTLSPLSLSSLSPGAAMLCWGKAEEGALGLGGIEELVVPQPTRNKHLGDRGVRTVGMYPASSD